MLSACIDRLTKMYYLRTLLLCIVGYGHMPNGGQIEEVWAQQIRGFLGKLTRDISYMTPSFFFVFGE